MSNKDVRAPYLTYEKIRPIAAEFLDEYNPESEIPVPIEHIIEYCFKINIIPANSIRFLYGIDGWISNDLKSIYVDYQIYSSDNNYRYLFTIAHEIGHVVLHGDIFRSLSFSRVEEWVDIVNSIDSNQYGYLEFHAYCFAGLILVPESTLKKEYVEAVSKVESLGFDTTTVIFGDYVSNHLQKRFDVSSQTIAKRLKYDGLVNDI